MKNKPNRIAINLEFSIQVRQKYIVFTGNTKILFIGSPVFYIKN